MSITPSARPQLTRKQPTGKLIMSPASRYDPADSRSARGQYSCSAGRLGPINPSRPARHRPQQVISPPTTAAPAGATPGQDYERSASDRRHCRRRRRRRPSWPERALSQRPPSLLPPLAPPAPLLAAANPSWLHTCHWSHRAQKRGGLEKAGIRVGVCWVCVGRVNVSAARPHSSHAAGRE